MDMKKLGTSLTLLGVVLMAAAIYWWWTFYAPLAHKLDVDLSHATSCIYSNSGVCSFATGIAQLSGKTPYSPVLAWAGAACAVLGILIRLARLK
ncbi:MAG: hypothetical protein JO002_04115 [Burkholderiaceae bacterium]|nr:hypothetical protein [Burkholderiaceae bacterium]